MQDEASAFAGGCGPVAEYLDHLAVERGLSSNSIEAYRRDLGTYVAFLDRRGVELRDVTRADIEAFAMARRLGGYAVSSVERSLSAVRGLHRFMLREGSRPQTPHLRSAAKRRSDCGRDLYRRRRRACLTSRFPKPTRASAIMLRLKCCMGAVYAQASWWDLIFAMCIWTRACCA